MGIDKHNHWNQHPIHDRSQYLDPNHWREDELRAPRKRRTNPWAAALRVVCKGLLILGLAAASLWGWQQWQQPGKATWLHSVPSWVTTFIPWRHTDKTNAVPSSPVGSPVKTARNDRQAQEQAAAIARKNAAWDRYYQPSAFCRQEATVECANIYIRAKRKFEQEYQE